MSDLALLARSVRAENRIFWRTPIGAFFTLGLPLIMLVLFVALFGNESIGETAYGDITTAQFYAAGLAVFASASATYTNVAINLTMRRDRAAIHTPDNTTPLRKTHGGIGVLRIRFSTPSSRRMVRLIATFV